MFDAFFGLNWVTVAVAIVAYFVVGGIYYQFLVKQAYSRALGKEMKGGLLSLLVPFACIAVTVITSAILIRALEISSYGSAAEFGSLIGLGYLTPMVLNIAWNPLFPRPFYYTLINAPYFVAGSILTALILVAFR